MVKVNKRGKSPIGIGVMERAGGLGESSIGHSITDAACEFCLASAVSSKGYLQAGETGTEEVISQEPYDNPGGDKDELLLYCEKRPGGGL